MDAGTSQRYNCVCSGYNYGRPHPVSSATFHRHLRQARSEEEKKCIQDAKFDGLDRPVPHRSRGTASRRRDNQRDNIRPAQVQELDELQTSVDRQQELDVYISFFFVESFLTNTPGWFLVLIGPRFPHHSFEYPHF